MTISCRVVYGVHPCAFQPCVLPYGLLSDLPCHRTLLPSRHLVPILAKRLYLAYHGTVTSEPNYFAPKFPLDLVSLLCLTLPKRDRVCICLEPKSETMCSGGLRPERPMPRLRPTRFAAICASFQKCERPESQSQFSCDLTSGLAPTRHNVTGRAAGKIENPST